MTVNALRRPPSSSEGQEPTIAIGDPDGAIFVCTACARPLASGVKRCPGCGARYVVDVPVRKAGLLLTTGLAAGLIVGGGAIGLAAATRPAAAAPSAPVASQPAASATAPGTSPAPTAVVVPDVPPAAVAALRGTSTINGRIAEIAVPLAVAADASVTDASLIARHLRRLSVEVGAAETLVGPLATWDDATAYAAELETFYGTLLARVRTGLDSTVRDEAAYRRTATDVLALIEALPALEATGRALAAQATSTAP